MSVRRFGFAACLALAAVGGLALAAEEDPYLWLEDPASPQALAWASARTDEARAELEADPRYAGFAAAALEIYAAADKLEYPILRGPYVDNIWQDARHPRGLWRRTDAAAFAAGRPEWRTVLDFDALAAEAGGDLVFRGSTCAAPDYVRCLVFLAPSGGDAAELREYRADEGRFALDGFRLPAAKTDAVWLDAETIAVASDFGPGSLSAAGYPRTVRVWRRGEAIGAAREVYAGDPSSAGCSCGARAHGRGASRSSRQR